MTTGYTLVAPCALKHNKGREVELFGRTRAAVVKESSRSAAAYMGVLQ